jgi:hypothetical protein
MRTVKHIKKLSLKDDFETKRKGNRKSGRAFRKVIFRSLRKHINLLLNKQIEN